MNWAEKYAFFMDLVGNDNMAKTLANYSKINDEGNALLLGNPQVLKILRKIIEKAYQEKGITLDGFKKGKYDVCVKKLIRYGIDISIGKIVCAEMFKT